MIAHVLTRRDIVLQPKYQKFSSRDYRSALIAFFKLKRSTPMPIKLERESLVTFGNHGFDAHQSRSLRRPIARTSRPVLSGNYHERRIFLFIFHRSI